MIVCLCRAVREHDVARAIAEGASTVRALGERTGAGTDCGACACELRSALTARGLVSVPQDDAPCSGSRPMVTGVAAK